MMTIKRTVLGIGYNSGGVHIVSVDGMRTHTYMTWYNMMTRCYSKKLHNRFSQYAVCEVIDEWHNFQNFADWYTNHEFYGLGYDLDKDLLVPNNKIYSPDTCCLIPQELNKLITTGKVVRKCMVGASWNRRNNKWLSTISVNGKQIYLGSFSTELGAHKAYIEEKESIVRASADLWFGKIEAKAYEALTIWSYSSAMNI